MDPLLAVMALGYLLVLVVATISLAHAVLADRTVTTKTAGLGAVLAVGYIPVAGLLYAWLVLAPSTAASR